MSFEYACVCVYDWKIVCKKLYRNCDINWFSFWELFSHSRSLNLLLRAVGPFKLNVYWMCRHLQERRRATTTKVKIYQKNTSELNSVLLYLYFYRPPSVQHRHHTLANKIGKSISHSFLLLFFYFSILWLLWEWNSHKRRSHC